MAKTIMRMVKLKGAGAISGSSSHVFRERETLNANPNPEKPNVYLGAKSTAELRAAIDARIATATNKVIRCDMVPVVEFLISASPDFFKKPESYRKKFFKQSLDFYKNKFGAENVISFAVHFDERTPHAHVYVVPIDPLGKLNAKHYFGGRYKMHKLQTEYAASVADLGLERGKEWSKSKHQTLQSFYGTLGTQAEYDAMQADLHASIEQLEVKKQEVEKQEKDLLNREAALMREIPLPAVLVELGQVDGVELDPSDPRNFRVAGKKYKGAIDLVKIAKSFSYEKAVWWLKEKFGKSAAVGEALKTHAEYLDEMLLKQDFENQRQKLAVKKPNKKECTV